MQFQDCLGHNIVVDAKRWDPARISPAVLLAYNDAFNPETGVLKVPIGADVALLFPGDWLVTQEYGAISVWSHERFEAMHQRVPGTDVPQLRGHIPYGYVTYAGTVLSNLTIDGYNAIQDDIDRWILARRAVPEWLLDWSFRYFRDAVEISLSREG